MKFWSWKCDDCNYTDYRYYWGLSAAKHASKNHKCKGDNLLAETNITYTPLNQTNKK